MIDWRTLVPPSARLPKDLARRHARNQATRWSVWLGADTSSRLALARGIPFRRAWHLLRAAARDGVIVPVGTRPTGGMPAIRYATPDPEQFP